MWFMISVSGSHDHRIIIFFIGLVALGLFWFVAAPKALLKKVVFFNNKRQPVLGKFSLWCITALAFFASSLLLEIALQYLVPDVEVNDLPLLGKLVVPSLIFASLGNTICIYDPKPDNSHIKIFPCIIAMALLLVSVTYLLFGQP